MRSRPIKAVIVFLALVVMSGCGYHVAGKASRLPEGVESLVIPVFENRTAKPDIESDLTAAFVTEFVTSVKVQDDAAHSMNGVILSYELTPISYSKSDVNQEYRLTVVLALTIVDIASGRVVWKEDGLMDSEDFTVDISDVSVTAEREEAALKKLARDTARLVKERMLERF